MKERPILFNAPMVRAIITGTKTQTRREFTAKNGGVWPNHNDLPGMKQILRNCRYGQPGDRLWVRESGWERPERTAKMMREGADTWPRFAYAADDWSDQDRADFKAWGFKPRPSIHMPRWASRILLEIVTVRVERLQDISEEDARAEGAEPFRLPTHPARESLRHVDGFSSLWESINGPGSWAANPWVWVVEFKRDGAA